MEKELKRIMKELNRIYKGKHPMIEIFGDGSWMIEIDGLYYPNGKSTKCRIGGATNGNSIEELEKFLINN